ncbi:hypothetical protein WMY93_026524 [Mugilogobius chulae]|uniref:Ig-like domain-containing protein n=1 Tax=Mugilogobius chulae TaxID=88201 RepID=A0AAW0N7S1_9GOBI
MIYKCIIVAVFLLFKDVDCEEVFAGVGSTAVLPCKTIPWVESPAVSWSNSKGSMWRIQRDGLQYWSLPWASRVRCPHTGFELGDYSLQIFSVKEEDAGSYICSVVKDSRPVTTVVTLRVIQVSVSPAAPLVGQSVRIVCSVNHRDLVRRSVSWELNGRPYEDRSNSRSRSHFGRDADTTLNVKASESLSGNWTCVVRSQNGEGRASGLLEVKGIVNPPSDDTQIFAAVGSAVSLPCVFSNGLTPSGALWERLQSQITSKPSVGDLPDSFSPPLPLVSTRDKSARLREVSFEDSGRYRCSATVNGVKIERNMQLVTAKVEAQVSETDGSVKLTCRLSRSSPDTNYEWIYTTSDLNGTQVTTTVQKSQTVTVSRTSAGLWTCRFYGPQGLLGNVTYQVHNRERQKGAESVRSVSRGAAFLLAGLCLLITLLLIVLSQMYRNYQRSKNTLQFPALETVLHVRSVEKEMKERRQNQK